VDFVSTHASHGKL